MTGLHELSFNGYRLDTRNGRKFDATLVNDKQAVPAGLYEMSNGTGATFPKQQSSVVRDYGLRPAT